ncbi:MAG: alpha/beta hydrolase [Flavobacteriales bacterium]|nr:alpha/beta hydrolase [Flavobacteriales bacterium]MBK6945057.1 alpha/beta hydrolase [Flavobacteriales bacterium]MBK7239406.1 alpha/beta hydrolase [Flavobacteriales bacterium]MBK7295936.1 alpha/beta hydrolase [Flavobacteriales bacterium]MBK9535388.1 alpha/beta hydrolase [Flavobacteriales bacterium]
MLPLILGIILLLFLGYVLLCLFYFIFQERFIFVRYQLAVQEHFKFNYPFEERRISATDGSKLHGLYFTTGSPKGVVLYFHGNTGNLHQWGKVAPRFTKLGYDVLMPDYRDYGLSEGKLGAPELQSDAMKWYDFLSQQWKEEDIVIYGRSLGSGMATPVAAERRPRMLVLETPFANLYDVARYYLRILPYRLLLRYPFRNDKAMLRVQCPVYIFHGKRDTVVPYHSALKLYSLVPTTVEREMFTFEKGHHSDLAGFKRFNAQLRRIMEFPKA